MVVGRTFCLASASLSLCLAVTGCTIRFTNNLIPDSPPAEKPAPAREAMAVKAQAPAAPTAPAGDVEANVLATWDFASTGEVSVWRMGWNKTEDGAITDFDIDPKLGLKLTMDFHGSAWGDANIKAAWGDAAVPAAVRVTLMVPVAAGRPKGQMQMGCAMNVPWTEAKHWPSLKFGESVTIDGAEYYRQTVTCRLGTSGLVRAPSELVLRFGGDRIRFRGPMYIQQVQALAGPR